MLRSLVNLLRLGVVVVVVGFAAAQPARAEQRPGPAARGAAATHRSGAVPAGTATPDDRTAPADDPQTAAADEKGDPGLGLLWVVIGIGLLLLLLWAAIRMGDDSRPADKNMI